MAEDNQEKLIEETIERAELLYKYQIYQYELAVGSIRRLEDKAAKLLSFLSIVITVALIIVRYWWSDIFQGDPTPEKIICRISVFLFLVLVIFSWGFAFSAMLPEEFEKPCSSIEMTDVFLMNKRYESMTRAANSYSNYTDVVDGLHREKVRAVRFCAESMLFSAWIFVIFLMSVSFIKLTI